jgi:hypothetical protein
MRQQYVGQVATYRIARHGIEPSRVCARICPVNVSSMSFLRSRRSTHVTGRSPAIV